MNCDSLQFLHLLGFDSNRGKGHGRWLAYVSDESGRYEIYVQPHPGPGGKYQISIERGTEPVRARNGELFYRNGEKVMVAETTAHPTFATSNPKVLFEGRYATDQTMPDCDVFANTNGLFFKTGSRTMRRVPTGNRYGAHDAKLRRDAANKTVPAYGQWPGARLQCEMKNKDARV